jgi:AcrR family transcriptional regulator
MTKGIVGMAAPSVTKMKPAAGRNARHGRPPKEYAGEVEERILDAARHVFLNRGFEGATIEEIAETARAGKPTIYARYGNKRELFAAAFTQFLAARTLQVKNQAHAGATVKERLEGIAVALLRQVLSEESIGLSRLAIAEARQFPEFASGIIGTARERGLEAVAQLMIEAAQAGELKDFAPLQQERAIRAAVPYFVELIILPLVLAALSGEKLDELREGVDAHVAARVQFFLAACCNGGIAQLSGEFHPRCGAGSGDSPSGAPVKEA